FENLMVQIRNSMERAVKDVMTCEPDALIMGMSSETFWGGKQGNKEFEEGLRKMSGLQIYSGANACHEVLQALNAKRLGIVTPYQPVGDDQVRGYFEEMGYDVVNLKGLKCPTAVSIAEVTEETLRQSIMEVNGPDV